MHPHFQKILEEVLSNQNLTEEQRNELVNSIEEAEKLHTITEFKLERTEKVKKTTAVLLEETITELEKKNKEVEERAREAEIETAVEKVRARSLGMRKPEDLSKVAEELYSQVEKLDMKGITGAELLLFDENDHVTMWDFSDPGNVGNLSKKVVSFDPAQYPVLGLFVKPWKKGKDYFEIEYTPEKWKEALKEWKRVDNDIYIQLKKLFENGEILTQWNAFSSFSHGLITLDCIGKPGAENRGFLNKMAGAFELAYKRFLDLQQAEAQAREAQIEAALERVRARTMAMHRSEELVEVATVLHYELRSLNVHEFSETSIVVHDEPGQKLIVWGARTGSGSLEKSVFPLLGDQILQKLYDTWRRQEDFFTLKVEGAALRKHIDFVFPKARRTALENEAIKSMPDPTFFHCAFYCMGYLELMSDKDLSEDSSSLLVRFARVFDQAYTRYLDLQQAEAQAREAQIEAALERVRTRSMAMHNSDELQEVIKVVFNQINVLGLVMDSAQFDIFEEGSNDSNGWIATKEYQYAKRIKTPYFKSPVIDTYLKAKRKKPSTYTMSFSKSEKDKYWKYVFKHSDLSKIPSKRKKYLLSSKGLDQAGAILNDLSLSINNYKGISYSEDETLIIRRFAEVFQQTYTRFLDLQKAEAQAREAQIEVALERVRARTMAMHKSQELKEVVSVMYNEMELLGLAKWGCNIMIFHEESTQIENWVAEETDSNHTGNYFAKGKEHPVYRKLWNHWKKQGPPITLHHQDAYKREFDEYWLGKTDFKHLPDVVKKSVFDRNEVFLNYATMRYGMLNAISYVPINNEMLEILARFSKVFEQTYTRFLDLQKAEAQAREAQIEASLEKVRGTSMAMHKSEDLIHVANVMNQEFEKLGFTNSLQASFVLIDEEKKVQYLWGAQTDSHLLDFVTLPLFGDDVLQERYDAWKQKEAFLSVALTGEKRKMHLEVAMPLESLSEREKKGREVIPDPFHICCGFIKYGYLTIISSDSLAHDQQIILARMAKVFEQTYTRFLDLQKAEAQAREAQIETALERVRSRTMGMQKSEELREVIQLVFEQFVQLGFVIDSAQFDPTFRETEDLNLWTAVPGQPYSFKIHIPYFDHIVFNDINKAKENKKIDLLINLYNFEEKNEFFEHFFQHVPSIPKERQQYIFKCKGLARSTVFLNTINLGIQNYSGIPYTDAENSILRRFGRVFAQTYTRFVDLQKAEAQAREALIEAAMEKVRSRSMAMQQSTELNEVAVLLHQEMRTLGTTQFLNCGYVEVDEPENMQQTWMTNLEGGETEVAALPLTGDPVCDERYKSWRKQEPLFQQTVRDKALSTHFEFAIPFFGSVEREVMVRTEFPSTVTFYCANFPQGYLHILSGTKLTADEEDLLVRFTKVFKQAYTRFLDLQQAEAQAQEAQIETALERVRSRTMGMQKSEELKDVVKLIFDQLADLKINAEHAGIVVDYEPKKDWHFWIAETQDIPAKVTVPYLDLVWDRQFTKAKKKGKDFFTTQLDFDEKNSFYKELLPHIKGLTKKARDFYFSCSGLAISTVIQEDIGLYIENFSGTPYAEEENDILKRFGKVFQQTYTRFLDLQKAEGQARETEIELALERVRARAMAMKSSNEIADLIITVFQELQKLDMELTRCLLWIFNPEDRSATAWMTNSEDPDQADSYHVPYHNHPAYKSLLKGWKDHQTKWEYDLKGKIKDRWDELLVDDYFKTLPARVKKAMKDAERVILSGSFNKYGVIQTASLLPLSEENQDILQRFSQVFEQNFTRFLDLQKAEAQAREAQIEAALERVRAKAMAMHDSNDLITTAGIVFTELRKLGISSFRSGVGLLTKESRDVEIYSAATTEDTDSLSLVGWATLDNHPILSALYENWVHQQDYFPILRGEEIGIYYETLKSGFKLPKEQLDFDHHGYFLPFSEGTFYGWSEIPYTQDEIKIFHRFKAIIDLTFRRYIELKKSEASALATVRSASLDRVRAEIASMRTADDLNRITPLVWRELTTLGVPFFRCGVFIVDEASQYVRSFLSTPTGDSLAAIDMKFGSNALMTAAVENWKKNKVHREVWDKAYFTEWTNSLLDQGLIADPKTYQHGEEAPDKLVLHLVPFSQGMLYVGSKEELSEDQIELVHSLADSFSVAYARYEDFRELEYAKEKVEGTLTELKSTQDQLVHSEKMASLGELTAGIAHEIQNPLNFVNNFSDINKELAEELIEEIQNGNAEEAEAIIADIIGNEEKIHHHGKRAEEIVRSMLLHSRGSSGEKESTDINLLADEYMRLSFHGMRAKDKSFNADFKLDLEEGIPNINVVQQDIGRVLLNLINNAFYATNEKRLKLDNGQDYQPTVILSTRLISPSGGGKGEVKISLKDNGSGIPKNVLDKIYQPFYTTKPTGEGTGLGLSLSFDIITKGHGGTIDVKSKEGKGTEFIIVLPVV